MVFTSIRRSAAWIGLTTALTFIVPAGTGFAATHQGPTAITITPLFAANIASGIPSSPSSAGEGAVEMAQHRQRVRRRRIRRNANRRNRRRANRRVRRRVARRTRRRVARRTRRRVNNRIRRRRYHNGRWYYYRNGGYYDNAGVALAAGIIGLAAGAAIAGAYDEPDVVVVEPGFPAPYSAAWYRQCSRKYRSFRASDGTFLGFDGIRRVCRLP